MSKALDGGTILVMDAIQEVAEAAARRKAKIREWAAKQVDPTLAVTEIKSIVPEDPSPEEVQKVNMQGADETLGGPANEDATVKGEAPVYENASEVTNSEHYSGAPAADEEEDEVQENDPSEADEESDDVQEVESDSEEDEAPAESANKGEWVAYRIKTHNLSEDEANEKTKAQLIALD